MTGPDAVPRGVASFAGRFLVALLFWWSGVFGFVMNWDASIGMIAGRGLPAPALLGIAAAAFEILGPVALLVRRTAPWAALALGVFCLLTAVLFHAFWSAGPDDRFIETVQFFNPVFLDVGSLDFHYVSTLA